MGRGEERASPRIRLSPPRLTGYLAMAAALGLSVWLIAQGGSSAATGTLTINPNSVPTTQGSTGATGPATLTVAGLKARVETLGQPAYWAGTAPGRSFALS